MGNAGVLRSCRPALELLLGVRARSHSLRLPTVELTSPDLSRHACQTDPQHLRQLGATRHWGIAGLAAVGGDMPCRLYTVADDMIPSSRPVEITAGLMQCSYLTVECRTLKHAAIPPAPCGLVPEQHHPYHALLTALCSTDMLPVKLHCAHLLSAVLGSVHLSLQSARPSHPCQSPHDLGHDRLRVSRRATDPLAMAPLLR